MAAHLTIVSENSVDEIWDGGELDTFFEKNSVAQVSKGLSRLAPGGCSHPALILDSEGSQATVPVEYLLLWMFQRENYY